MPLTLGNNQFYVISVDLSFLPHILLDCYMCREGACVFTVNCYSSSTGGSWVVQLRTFCTRKIRVLQYSFLRVLGCSSLPNVLGCSTLPNVTRHWWPHTVTPSIDRALHQFLTITDLDLLPNLTFYLIVQGFHRTYATGAACQQRTLTPPDTWSCPTLGLACVLMSRPISPELVLSPDFWISNTPRYFSFASVYMVYLHLLNKFELYSICLACL